MLFSHVKLTCGRHFNIVRSGALVGTYNGNSFDLIPLDCFDFTLAEAFGVPLGLTEPLQVCNLAMIIDLKAVRLLLQATTWCCCASRRMICTR